MIRYLISSNVRYAPLTLPRLLKSLRAQIEPERILVAIGAVSGLCRETHRDLVMRREYRDGVFTLLVPHNSFDYTGPIAVLEAGLESDWWFWLHDTCEAGPRFRELVEGGFNPSVPITGADWHSLGMPFANLGIYSQAAFERSRAALLALKDCTKLEACEADGVCWRAVHGTDKSHSDRQKSVYPNAGITVIDAATDRYGTGTLRIRSHLRAVDLYKDQANFGQGGWNVKL